MSLNSSYDEMNRVLISDDVDHQCIDMLVANGFQVEKDVQLAKKPDELIQKLQVQLLLFFPRILSKIDVFFFFSF